MDCLGADSKSAITGDGQTQAGPRLGGDQPWPRTDSSLGTLGRHAANLLH